LTKARPSDVIYLAARYPTVRWPRSPQESTLLIKRVMMVRARALMKVEGRMMNVSQEKWNLLEDRTQSWLSSFSLSTKNRQQRRMSS
jgi:hypothetical protein